MSRKLLKRSTLLMVALILGAQLLPAAASTNLPSSAQGSGFNMLHEVNHPNIGGNSLAFFERLQPDGSTKRYAVAAAHANGFDIVDVTTPDSPVTVSRYVTPGVNYHPWVQVNGPRNIVALSIEEPGVSPAHGMSNGIEFVDITNLEQPVRLGLAEAQGGTRLGAASAIGGPHTIRMIGENHIYTTLPTYIIDYTNPRNPKVSPGPVCGHEFLEDPNIPGRTYVGMCGAGGKWGVLDTSDPAKPKLISEVRDLQIEYAHEVFPSPDSSFVGVGDLLGGGQTQTRCPGGGIHFYDISGRFIEGASLTNPKKLGIWFAPFTGVASDPNSTQPNWASCTLHSWQFQPEREIFTAGIYAGGTWVGDPRNATQPGGAYAEYSGKPAPNNPGQGPTTWGNTLANWRNPGDYVNATQWYPFGSGGDRSLFVNGMFRGLDILEFEGDLPKKESRLSIDASAAGGVVSGVLDRYAVLTYEGWVNKPLAGKTLEISAGGTTVTATTGPDGSFSADLGLASGNHQVTVAWAGDEEFEANSLSRQVSA